MCNIAGYIGDKPAAPILVEMMSKQSGFGGGYYTGIATMHDGKLYYAKVAGDLDKLVSETNALELPGSIGFIHSRSFGQQNSEWAHPFISDNEKLAYIANGYGGALQNKERATSIANELLDEGCIFRTSMRGESTYIYLKDGSTIHTSELDAHVIAKNYRSGMDFGAAMMQTLTDIPCEVVSLAMHTDFPDTIFVTRINFPMTIAKANNETFLATTTIAFPEDREFYSVERLPCLSLSEVTRSGYNVRAMKHTPMCVQPIDASISHDAYDLICEKLKNATAEAPVSVGELVEVCNTLWDNDKLCQADMLTYEIIGALYNKGVLKIVKVEDEGPAPDIKTTHFRLYMD